MDLDFLNINLVTATEVKYVGLGAAELWISNSMDNLFRRAKNEHRLTGEYVKTNVFTLKGFYITSYNCVSK